MSIEELMKFAFPFVEGFPKDLDGLAPGMYQIYQTGGVCPIGRDAGFCLTFKCGDYFPQLVSTYNVKDYLYIRGQNKKGAAWKKIILSDI